MPFLDMEQDSVDKVIDVDISKLTTISSLTQMLDHLEYQKVCQEEALKNTMRQIEEIKRTAIPDRLMEAGVSTIKLVDGRVLSVRSKVHASISKDNEVEAFQWLEATNNSDIIKNEVIVSFKKGEEQDTQFFIEMLKDTGLTFKRKVGVHSSTLSAFVKAELETNQEFPKELFGVYTYNEAVIK